MRFKTEDNMQLNTNSHNKIFVIVGMLFLLQMLFITPSLAKSNVVVTVGNGTITEYDVKIRSNFELIVKNKSSTARNRANVRKKVIDKLINEKVQLQTGARFGISASKGEVDRRIRKIASGAKMSVSQLANFLKARGSNISTMKDLQEAGIIWGGIVRAKFGSASRVSEKIIDEEASKLGKRFGGKQTVYDLQHIILKMPSNANRAKRTQRQKEAKQVRAEFTKCSRIRTVTAGLPRVEVKARPNTSLSTLSSGQRSLVRAAKVGTITKYRTIKGGVEMFAVCKKTTAHSTKARTYVQKKLVQERFTKFAEDYLKSLRGATNVQYR